MCVWSDKLWSVYWVCLGVPLECGLLLPPIISVALHLPVFHPGRAAPTHTAHVTVTHGRTAPTHMAARLPHTRPTRPLLGADARPSHGRHTADLTYGRHAATSHPCEYTIAVCRGTGRRARALTQVLAPQTKCRHAGSSHGRGEPGGIRGC